MAKKQKAVEQAQAAVVMCRNNWPGTFKRSVRGEDGEIVDTLQFPPGVPVKLSEGQFAIISGDIGKALVEVELDDIGRPRVIDRSESTDQSEAEVVESESNEVATVK